jgi:alpha-tubulin suppressor-like RCC1 family protein
LQAWATGMNNWGQLGLGDTTHRSTPAQLSSPTSIVQVAAGGAFTVFMDASGAVRVPLLLSLYAVRAYAFSSDCLSVSVLEESCAACLIRLAHLSHHGHCALAADVACVRLQTWATGNNNYGQLGLGDTTEHNTPVQLPSSPTSVVQVAAGSGHTVLLAHA